MLNLHVKLVRLGALDMRGPSGTTANKGKREKMEPGFGSLVDFMEFNINPYTLLFWNYYAMNKNGVDQFMKMA